MYCTKHTKTQVTKEPTNQQQNSFQKESRFGQQSTIMNHQKNYQQNFQSNQLPFFIIEQTVKASSDSLCLIILLGNVKEKREGSILKLKHIL